MVNVVAIRRAHAGNQPTLKNKQNVTSGDKQIEKSDEAARVLK